VYLPLAEVKKNEFATNENGIHISPKIEYVIELRSNNLPIQVIISRCMYNSLDLNLISIIVY